MTKSTTLPKPSPLAFAATLALLLAGEAAMAKPARHHARAMPHPSAPAPALPPIAQRYAAAAQLLNKGAGDLLVDVTLSSSFTHDGTGLLYRKGALAARSYLYLDLTTHQEREIANQTDLARAFTQAGNPAVAPEKLRIEDADFDAHTGLLTFRAQDKAWQYDGKAVTAAPDQEEADPAKGLLSPDGHYRVIYRAYNLYAVDVASGREVPLTTDGTRDQPYGRDIAPLMDVLKQNTEEPVLPVSAQWSPDSRYLLSWRLDTRGVEPLSITQQSPVGSFMPHGLHYIYPLAGAKMLPLARRLVVDVQAAMKKGKARIVPIDMPAEALLYPAAPDMRWQDGHPVMTWTERGYARQVVYSADPDTGATTVLAEEAVSPVITVTSSALMPAPQLHGQLAISERSGWAQLWLIRPDAPKGGTPLTKGNWEVLSVDHIAKDGHDLIVTGVGREAKRNPYARALYRVTLDGSAPVELTPEPLDHDATVSDDGRWIVDAMSSPTSPTRTVLRDGQTGAIVRELGTADDSAWKAAGYADPELFQGVAADGKTPIQGMIFRPAHMDPAQHYPVIDNVYTGPTTTDVPATFSDAHRVSGNGLAQLGAIVVMIDGRGTSRRGQAFRLPAFQNLGEVGLDDHIALIRQMAARYPYMDVTRVGVYGGSAGGYDAARFMLRRPEFFKVGIASSGNQELRLDKAWWPEVSMGLADDATWERNSNLSVAKNLKGKLLLVHGDIDDNVPITASFRLEKALIDAGKDVDMVVLPNTRHAVYQPYYWKKFLDYFTLNLLGETPPTTPYTPTASH
mgnify:CR=1 FL=1